MLFLMVVALVVVIWSAANHIAETDRRIDGLLADQQAFLASGGEFMAAVDRSGNSSKELTLKNEFLRELSLIEIDGLLERSNLSRHYRDDIKRAFSLYADGLRICVVALETQIMKEQNAKLNGKKSVVISLADYRRKKEAAV